MSEYLADTYQNAFQLGEAALKNGHGLTIDTDAGVDTYWGPDLARFMDELAPGEPFEIVALVPMPEAPEDEPACAWTITRDHLADADNPDVAQHAREAVERLFEEMEWRRRA